ncbi:hypothetical protein QMO14_10875 [Variovorax sp. CAN2819]|uniref:hypothetical protein n=1 Tax=Variovorax sp. CAN15 TaxID=3046727 RepID=UPI002649A978|nr:hypothetical protein [Variovorax sp. CAN15]MDN6884098.1 hypothetical protein [Variovorax sp. CAN15]
MTPLRHAWRPAALSALCMLGATPGTSQALTETEPLPLIYEAAPEPSERPNSTPAPALRVTSGCTLYVPRIDDTRLNKANVGNLTLMMPTLHATPVKVQSIRAGGDPVGWTRGALQSASRYGLQVASATLPSTGAGRQVTADVALRLAHSWSSGLNLVSHVVLQASYRMPGNEPVVRQYHGMGTRANWASGNGEFMSVLNLGMEEAVHGLVVDVAALCDGKPLPARAPAP